MMYSLDEIGLLPSMFPTDINHRSEVDPFDKDGKLPVFVSPMTCILDEENFQSFYESKFIPIMPRGKELKNWFGIWYAVSLSDFNNLFESGRDLSNDKILIDIANGHMKKLYDSVRKVKSKFPTVTIMVGNIAHPQMYVECYNAGVDYVRCSIGSGGACSTSMLTGIHVSHEYLLRGIKSARRVINDPKCPKIVMDGGLHTIDRAIKCLALGADYVMMGKMFAECQEACGYITQKLPTKRAYYGMASEQGQVDLYSKVVKEPEGLLTHVIVDKTLDKFSKQFEAALRSSMSYTGCHNLEEFRNNVDYEIQSIAEFNSYYKK